MLILLPRSEILRNLFLRPFGAPERCFNPTGHAADPESRSDRCIARLSDLCLENASPRGFKPAGGSSSRIWVWRALVLEEGFGSGGCWSSRVLAWRVVVLEDCESLLGGLAGQSVPKQEPRPGSSEPRPGSSEPRRGSSEPKRICTSLDPAWSGLGGPGRLGG